MNILFITATRLGDSILTTGVLNKLTQDYPHARITVACGPIVTDIFHNVPQVKHIIELKKRPYNQHWLKLWHECWGQKWDLVVDFRNSVTGYILKARKRSIVRNHDKTQHVIDEYQQAFKLKHPPTPHIWILPHQRAMAKKLIPSTENTIAFAPTAGSGQKIWPWENFLSLWRQLSHNFPSLRLALFYGRGRREHDLAAPLLKHIPSALDFGARYSLTQIAALLERCRLFIGNDSGLMHLAAACKVPTLGLFGPSLSKRYGPWGKQSYHLDAPGPAGQAPITSLLVSEVIGKVEHILQTCQA